MFLEQIVKEYIYALWYLPITSDLAGSPVKIEFPNSLDGVNLQFSKGEILSSVAYVFNYLLFVFEQDYCMIARQDSAFVSNTLICLTRKSYLSLNIYRLLLHIYLKAHFHPGHPVVALRLQVIYWRIAYTLNSTCSLVYDVALQ